MDWNSIETWRLIEMWSSLAVNAWVIGSSVGVAMARLLGAVITWDLVLNVFYWVFQLLTALSVGLAITNLFQRGL